jgi:hypothetical protein
MTSIKQTSEVETSPQKKANSDEKRKSKPRRSLPLPYKIAPRSRNNSGSSIEKREKVDSYDSGISEDGDNNEILYSYWIPKKTSDNTSITYDFYNDTENNSMMSKEITNGVIVYFSKRNDVKEWVANDLQID